MKKETLDKAINLRDKVVNLEIENENLELLIGNLNTIAEIKLQECQTGSDERRMNTLFSEILEVIKNNDEMLQRIFAAAKQQIQENNKMIELHNKEFELL